MNWPDDTYGEILPKKDVEKISKMIQDDFCKNQLSMFSNPIIKKFELYAKEKLKSKFSLVTNSGSQALFLVTNKIKQKNQKTEQSGFHVAAFIIRCCFKKNN